MNRTIKRIGAFAIAMVMALTLVGCTKEDETPYVPDVSGAQKPAAIVIDASQEYQTIQGFGGINYPVWIDDLTEEQRETAFKNGDDQLGFTILRIHVDPNPDNWERELETAKYAQEQGALIFASPWNPPADMCEKFNHNGNENAQRLKHDKYADYARHLNDFVTFMREGGVELYAISIQNEPDFADEWTWWSTDEIMDFILNYSDAIDCRIMTPESFQYHKDFYDAILNDEQALSKIDIFGTHFYGTQKWDMDYPLFEEKGEGKELWMTEVYVPNSSSDADTWPEAIEVAINMSDAMTKGNMQAYVWWYIRRFYGPMKEDGTISKRGYMMAHFSKFVRPGYIRIEADERPAYSINTSAYKGDNEIVVVVINNSLTKYEQEFKLNEVGTIKSVDAYTTDVNENLAKASDVPFDGDTVTYVLLPESVTTLVITV